MMVGMWYEPLSGDEEMTASETLFRRFLKFFDAVAAKPSGKPSAPGGKLKPYLSPDLKTEIAFALTYRGHRFAADGTSYVVRRSWLESTFVPIRFSRFAEEQSWNS